jgi:two-component system alkaline phosphatase synthesis response regulator PhoP
MSNKKRILLVDDDEDFVESVKVWLEANDLEVMVAYDGATGLNAAIKEKPDLMILDVMMATDTEGIEVSRKIAEIPELNHMPVLMLTGMRKAKNLPFGLEPDANWLPVRVVLEKPVPPDQLLLEIKRLLGN